MFEGRLKLQHQDNIKRAPSLLHFNLNSTSSTLVVCFKAGATEAQLVAVNAALAKHHTNYKFKLGKKTRDSKADGEVCKRILWKRGLLMAMVHARWGPPTTPGARAADRDLDAAGADGGHLQEGDDQPLPPPAPRLPTVRDGCERQPLHRWHRWGEGLLQRWVGRRDGEGVEGTRDWAR